MKITKRIYLLKHAYVSNWVYVGATTETYLNCRFAKHWTYKHQGKSKLCKALRCSERSDWSIEQLHDFTEDWQRLEAEYIAKYDSFHNGLNSTNTGAGIEISSCTRLGNLAMKKLYGQSVLHILTGHIYNSIKEASEHTGVSRATISGHIQQNVRYSSKKNFMWVKNNC